MGMYILYFYFVFMINGDNVCCLWFGYMFDGVILLCVWCVFGVEKWVIGVGFEVLVLFYLELECLVVMLCV